MYTMIVKGKPEHNMTSNFSSKEFLCSCNYSNCNFSFMYTKTINSCQLFRKFIDEPLTITSAHRCQSHNRDVGGLDSSYHMIGHAVDIFILKDHTPKYFASVAKMFFDVVVLYKEEGFIHCHNA